MRITRAGLAVAKARDSLDEFVPLFNQLISFQKPTYLAILAIKPMHPDLKLIESIGFRWLKGVIHEIEDLRTILGLYIHRHGNRRIRVRPHLDLIVRASTED
jgi:hypothetical protein